jgi:hypothetical protein
MKTKNINIKIKSELHRELLNNFKFENNLLTDTSAILNLISNTTIIDKQREEIDELNKKIKTKNIIINSLFVNED